MGLKKGDVITKNDIFEYQIGKHLGEIPFNTFPVLVDVSISNAGVGQSKEKTEYDYFWVRNKPEHFTTLAWVVGNTYPVKYRCSYLSVVYECKVQHSGQQPNISPTYWRVVPNGVIYKNVGGTPVLYQNALVTLNIDGSITSADDFVQLTIYKVTWSNGVEQLAQVYYKDFGDKGTWSEYLSLQEGYYKTKSRVSTQGSSSTSRSRVGVRQYASDIEAGKLIRVFKPDYSELELNWQTPITADLAKSGRLTTVNYIGGDNEGT